MANSQKAGKVFLDSLIKDHISKSENINHVNENIFMLLTITGFIVLALLIYSKRFFSKSLKKYEDEKV